MRVYRLQYAAEPDRGPFNPPMSFQERIMGARLSVGPAEAAQVIADAFGVHGPFDMPAIQFDGVSPYKFETFKRKHEGIDGEVVFGFSSLEQYREWFPHALERKVLFQRHTTNGSDRNEDRGAESGLELVCFDVKAESVIVAGHQVAFARSGVLSEHVLSRKEATD